MRFQESLLYFIPRVFTFSLFLFSLISKHLYFFVYFFSENGHSYGAPQIESREGSVDLDVEPELSSHALGAEDRGARSISHKISLALKPTGVDSR